MDEFQWACYNWILGLPLEQMHYWALPSGKEFSRPEMLEGDYLAKEGLPVHCTVKAEDGKLTAIYDERKLHLLYSSESVFVGVDAADQEKRVNTFEFYIKNGVAWGVKCGSRIYQRVIETRGKV